VKGTEGGFAVTRPDWEARVWDIQTLRRFGFDSAALVFCQPADLPKYLPRTVSEAKTIEKRKIHYISTCSFCPFPGV